MGPKKSSGRGTQSEPKEVSIDDFVAAGDNKKENKSKQKHKHADAAGAGATPASTGADRPRPTAREMIGGASWTGKLPVNMLSEHCQKQRWEKPEYGMNKTQDGGFISSVTLRRKNAKTGAVTTLPPISPPASLRRAATQPSVIEARHFAAAYALFRVCNMRNLQMTLPPTYRDLWKGEFARLKTEDVERGRGWLYEADPFVATIEHEKALADIQRHAQKVKDGQGTGRPGQGGPTTGPSSNRDSWSGAVRVEMGARMRQTVESLVRQQAIWNPYERTIPPAERARIMDELTDLGFRHSHVEEAVAECKDREETLEWLLIHVPEDDLPSWCLPEGYSAGVSLASSDLVREGKIKRLAAAGYSADFCAELLDKNGGDEQITAEKLQYMLVGQEFGEEARSDVWQEEQDTLEAIYGDRYTKVTDMVCEVAMEHMVVSFRMPTLVAYPNNPPILCISGKGLPAYIRLSATRQAIDYARQDLLGEPMVFSIIDWLEQNMPGILENPGKLKTVSIEAISHIDTSDQLVKKRTRRPPLIDWTPNTPRSMAIQREWQARQSTSAQQKMLQSRQSLPAWSQQSAIIDSVRNHQVTIISGETGSGKSTQAVQFILDDLIQRSIGGAANLVVTQPRRISALGLADRVGVERCGRVGDEVGYVVRGDSRTQPSSTRLTFMTTGVLLRRMQTGGLDVVDSLADVSHVVVDEVHERSLDTDFLIALLRDVLKKRKDLRLILMSATLDAQAFSDYFASAGVGVVGQVNIPGRTFPVKDVYVGDVLLMIGWADPDNVGAVLTQMPPGINYELITAAVRWVDADLRSQGSAGDGAILIFLPGTLEIERCIGSLREIPGIYALPLHASLLAEEQRRVFFAPPPGTRKVIAATNVAETSITIADVVAVIDTGRVKETAFDAADNVVRLTETWASRAACAQRRGRAGRVRAGTCYKLYTQQTETSRMVSRPDPEIRRVPLDQLCLSVKAMRGVDDVVAFLSATLTPPETVAVDGALEHLHRAGALDHGRLTALGRYMALIPTDLRCAKLLVYGALFGALEPCLTIAALLTVKSPFVQPREKREEARAARLEFSVPGGGANPGSDGDLLIDLAAYMQWEERTWALGSAWKTQTWCGEHFLVLKTLREIASNRAQLLSSLQDVGIVPAAYSHNRSGHPGATGPPVNSLNAHATNTSLLRALIAGAFNPQIARIAFPDRKFASSVSGTIALDPEARAIKFFNEENGRVFVHPSSALFGVQAFGRGAMFVSYFSKIATTKVFLRDLTPFNAYTLLLFAGPITLDTLGRGILIDGWLRLRGWARIGVLVSRLRLLLDAALARRLASGDSWSDGKEKGEGNAADRVIELVRRLVVYDGQDR